jgi:hypothetical protein
LEQQETRRCLIGTIEQLGQPETMQFYRNNVKQTMQSFIGTKQNTKQKNNRKQANILSEQNKTSQQLIGTARNNLSKQNETNKQLIGKTRNKGIY